MKGESWEGSASLLTFRSSGILSSEILATALRSSEILASEIRASEIVPMEY